MISSTETPGALSNNLNPFPGERIQKAKLLLKLIYEFKKHIQADEFIQAGMKLRDLEIEGLKILPDETFGHPTAVHPRCGCIRNN